ncbi:MULTISPECIES: long-chain-fatty-acid--CoA ligase [unclassified Rhodococcus (in: high G+C Gram-positive bacteria)]|uniref:long-chain-fatty-acid--CoA ligase n=1 Tax=unclassified Rhodococcus (in: high G+C Gram-positive bacteria) TaxID=192944 RepID=UPI001639AED7|nr:MULTISPECIES: long-chain-fatty-acid--CoA ligase [unclassified Rhodococcus (in: high G+C Gram-positive bacteria)]MBC2640188.1 long-chain-fatty-acid--CoA ligase [Rhodococcus sp. 3A]MBC2895065.1 long-chain-fatty-acid--CoA ligase [Rhodococcus sp. 4CII]
MTTEIVQGLPSTHGDHYQLNTTTLIRHSARTYPEQEIVYRTADGGWDRYTYADAYVRIIRSANALRSIGIGPADVVGILDWNSKRHFELYWAIPGLAAAMLQMNLRLAPEDLGYVTGHSDASVVLVDESLLPVAEALAPHAPGVKTWIVMTDKPLSEIVTTLRGVVHWEDLLATADATIDWPVIDETSTYSACYTTGTTGRPKGIYYSHRGIYLHTLAQAAGLGMRSDDAVMLITPMFHGQSWGLPQAAVYSAAKVILPGRYVAQDTSVLVDAMITEQVTVANGAPAIFQPMMDYIKTLDVAPDFSRARLLSGATEPALSLMRDFYEITGGDIIHAYGATETTPLVAINGPLKPSLRGRITDEQKWDLKRPQGMPVNGIDIRIVDAEGNDLPHDGTSQGEVLLRGPWIIERYHKLDDDVDKFSGGYWRSGDVGRIDTNGYLKLTDRLKDVVKSGGEWISSIDMENALVGHPKIKEAAVVGVPHPKWQERPLALVVTVDGTELDLTEIHGVLDGTFAKWQFPDTVLFVDALPRTSVGKLDKKVLRSRHADLYTEKR